MGKVIFGVVTALLVVVVFGCTADGTDVEPSGAEEVSRRDPDDPLAGLGLGFDGTAPVNTEPVLRNYNVYQNCTSMDNCKPVTGSVGLRRAKSRRTSTTPQDSLASTAREQEPRDEPTVLKYYPRTQKWNDLPPARVERSSDSCVGYCFDAIIHSLSDEDPRVARVVAFGRDGHPMRAIVQGTLPYQTPSSPLHKRGRVRFTCFESSEANPVPRFEGCKHFATGMALTEKPKRAEERTPDPGAFDLSDPL